MPYIEQAQIATQKPIERCPRCNAEMDADFVDNGFGPYAVRASQWHCPECGYDEYSGMPESGAYDPAIPPTEGEREHIREITNANRLAMGLPVNGDE